MRVYLLFTNYDTLLTLITSEDSMEVEIKITGSGLQFESKVNLFQATQIMAFISRVDQANGTQDGQIIPEPAAGYSAEPKTLVEHTMDVQTIYESPHAAIAKTGAKTNPQKIVALAFYIGATSVNQKLFSVDDILACFKKAGESTPKNINRDFRDAVSAGYVYQEEKGVYRLLSSVDEVPSEGFKKLKRKKSAATSGGSRVKLVVRDEVKNARILTSIEGYPDYFKLDSRSDQVLWVVEYLKSEGVDGVNRAEVVYFTKKIGGKITSQNFTNSNMPNVKESYIYVESDLIKLTPKGEQQLKNAGTQAKESK